MPHIFKVKCYKDEAWNGRSKVGDIVYLKSNTNIPMTVEKVPHVNTAANQVGVVSTVWFDSDGSIKRGEFEANTLSL